MQLFFKAALLLGAGSPLRVQTLDFLLQCLDFRLKLTQPDQIQMGHLLLQPLQLPRDFQGAQIIDLSLHQLSLQKPLVEDIYPVSLSVQRFMDWCPTLQFFLQCSLPLPQPPDAQGHRLAPDKGVIHPCLWERPGHIALIDHAFGGDGNFIFPQLTGVGAANHPAQKVINVIPRQRMGGLHLFSQTVVPWRQLFPFPQLSHIHQSKGTSIFPFDSVKGSKRLLIVLRFYQQIKLLCVQISLHSAPPMLLPIGNFKKIGQNLYGNGAPQLFGRLLLQPLLERQQSGRIVLYVAAQFFQCSHIGVGFFLKRRQLSIQSISGISQTDGKIGRRSLGSLKGCQRPAECIRFTVPQRSVAIL
ncbi:hypothetical protein SDC9_74931 [bioreactor metagenome]|uniref:Uncharacterized protein n=1 Tax=bioreactor metagenome TaxID=1076179 RepID=A0A644YJ90_9ZZZZ